MPILSAFNAADSAIEPDLSFEVFEQSLVLNILFQPKIVMNEAYDMTSEYLLRHILSAQARQSLFEAATSKHIIVPAYRDSKTTSLRQAFAERINIYGREWLARSSTSNRQA